MTNNPNLKGMISPRELEVADMLFSNPNATQNFIADTLFISTKTVSLHINSLLKKLKVGSVSELIERYTFEDIELETHFSMEDMKRDPATYIGLIRRYQWRVKSLLKELELARVNEMSAANGLRVTNE